jgi:hypothetical protein
VGFPCFDHFLGKVMAGQIGHPFDYCLAERRMRYSLRIGRT